MKWEMVRLGDILDRQITGEWGTECVDNEGVRVLRTTNFTNDGKLDIAGVVFRNISDKKIKDKMLKNGDIILEKSGVHDNQPVRRVTYFYTI